MSKSEYFINLTSIYTRIFVNRAADRRTTISTTLEVISHEPDTDVPSVVPAIVQPKLSKTKLDPAAAQQLKRERTVTIKNLEEDIIRAGKALSCMFSYKFRISV